ncbi:hypothetical protein D0864_05892 [Hortaea werneckii]|uniref:Uncharacterized protein n=1 Tax=Hortaea werneckii TaxID=91943 RepID=A0A3M7FU91_HORWE|nr:hypothetical protein D0864_05892 [Hortaea werneckii]
MIEVQCPYWKRANVCQSPVFDHEVGSADCYETHGARGNEEPENMSNRGTFAPRLLLVLYRYFAFQCLCRTAALPPFRPPELGFGGASALATMISEPIGRRTSVFYYFISQSLGVQRNTWLLPHNQLKVDSKEPKAMPLDLSLSDGQIVANANIKKRAATKDADNGSGRYKVAAGADIIVLLR